MERKKGKMVVQKEEEGCPVFMYVCTAKKLNVRSYGT